MNIGNALKEVRVHKGVTQVQLSKKTGISQTSISQIGGGHRQPSKRTIRKFCKALNVPESILFVFGLENKDIPKEKKYLFNKLYAPLKALAFEVVEMKPSKKKK